MREAPWTLALCFLLLILNLGLFPWAPAAFADLLGWLQYDRTAILQGELWRVVTGNLVHWGPNHFLLDVGVFLVVGLLYERQLGRGYPWLVLGTALAIGLGLLLFEPGMEKYRGLSGVDSGQFAAAVLIEIGLARREGRRWLWVAPAAVVFFAKIAFECATGRMFFGTESLGDIGTPVPLAHAVGAAAGVMTVILGDGARNSGWKACDWAAKRLSCSLPLVGRVGEGVPRQTVPGKKPEEYDTSAG